MIRTVVIAASFTFCVSAAWSHAPGKKPQDTFSGMVAASDAIIRGRVSRIEFRMSEPSGGISVPYTFVTYDVSEVLRGALAGRTLTLKFYGGVARDRSVFTDDATPVFAKGQEDVLFAGRNRAGDCPLIGCVDGRFRIADGKAFNAWGVPIVSVDRGVVARGKPRIDLNVMELSPPSFDEFLARPGTRERLAKKYPGESLESIRTRMTAKAPKSLSMTLALREPSTGEAGPRGPAAAAPPPMTADAFLAAVRAEAARAPAPTGRVVSADPSARFSAYQPDAVPVRARGASRPLTHDEQRSIDNRAEDPAR